MMPRDPWIHPGFYAWSLDLEVSTVIALRTLKIAIGGAAAEAQTRTAPERRICPSSGRVIRSQPIPQRLPAACRRPRGEGG